MDSYISEIQFITQRFNGKSVIDILLVTLVIFFVLQFVWESQARTLLRGVVFAFIIIGLLFVLTDLPAFSWLIQTLLPVLIIVVPVIFAPEIRRGFERMGRINSLREILEPEPPHATEMYKVIDLIADASARLAAKNHGALIVMERYESLEKYEKAGVLLNADISAELLLQIFYPNTPLHDGAVLIREGKIAAAACVMPLSSLNVLDETPERNMGLRHRAALGASEATDAVTIVVSEERGTISLAYNRKIVRGISLDQLTSELRGFYKPPENQSGKTMLKRFVEKKWRKITSGDKS